MAFNPTRSWAVCYNQMWNLSMRDPLPKNNQHYHKGQFQFHSFGKNNENHNNSSNNGSAGGSNKKRPDYCWNFNKGVPCKYGKRCKFIERCRYCDSPAHGVHVCPKLEQKKNGGGEGHGTNDK